MVEPWVICSVIAETFFLQFVTQEHWCKYDLCITRFFYIWNFVQSFGLVGFSSGHMAHSIKKNCCILCKPFYVLHRVRVHNKAVGHNFWICNSWIIKIDKSSYIHIWISFQYKSYCCLHRRGQKVGRQKRKNKVNECGICHESITPKPGPTSILAPCCNGAWFHHKCVQTMALNHGNLLRGIDNWSGAAWSGVQVR